jgi:hypothetical protein
VNSSSKTEDSDGFAQIIDLSPPDNAP